MRTPPADDGGVVGHGEHLLRRLPDTANAAVFRGLVARRPGEAYRIGRFGTLEFPRVADMQPVLGNLVLRPVDDHLAEQPVIIADPVTDGRQRQAR
jgi:hypothetical protein